MTDEKKDSEDMEETAATTNEDTAARPGASPDETTEVADLAEPNGADESGKRIQELENALLYLRAEFDNYKKRMKREEEKAIRFANEKIIGELLFVMDLLDRALTHGTSAKVSELNKDAKALVDGISMTREELVQMMARFGAELIGNEGEPFNPAYHEAISQMEAPPEKTNTILSVLQRGCLLHGRLLKPAKVVVAKPPAPEDNKA